MAGAWWRAWRRRDPAWNAVLVGAASAVRVLRVRRAARGHLAALGRPRGSCSARSCSRSRRRARAGSFAGASRSALAVSLAAVALVLFATTALDVRWPFVGRLRGAVAGQGGRRASRNEEIVAEIERRLQPGEMMASESYTDVHLYRVPLGRPDAARGSPGCTGASTASRRSTGTRPRTLRGRDFLFVTERTGLAASLAAVFASRERGAAVRRRAGRPRRCGRSTSCAAATCCGRRASSPGCRRPRPADGPVRPARQADTAGGRASIGVVRSDRCSLRPIGPRRRSPEALSSAGRRRGAAPHRRRCRHWGSMMPTIRRLPIANACFTRPRACILSPTRGRVPVVDDGDRARPVVEDVALEPRQVDALLHGAVDRHGLALVLAGVLGDGADLRGRKAVARRRADNGRRRRAAARAPGSPGSKHPSSVSPLRRRACRLTRPVTDRILVQHGAAATAVPAVQRPPAGSASCATIHDSDGGLRCETPRFASCRG